jgi:hypothetical protein
VRRSRFQYCYQNLPLDLHVLSLPLAFILSQDQTLHGQYLQIIQSPFRLFISQYLSLSPPYNSFLSVSTKSPSFPLFFLLSLSRFASFPLLSFTFCFLSSFPSLSMNVLNCFSCFKIHIINTRKSVDYIKILPLSLKADCKVMLWKQFTKKKRRLYQQTNQNYICLFSSDHC